MEETIGGEYKREYEREPNSDNDSIWNDGLTEMETRSVVAFLRNIAEREEDKE
jgi:hypothetical protein